MDFCIKYRKSRTVDGSRQHIVQVPYHQNSSITIAILDVSDSAPENNGRKRRRKESASSSPTLSFATIVLSFCLKKRRYQRTDNLKPSSWKKTLRKRERRKEKSSIRKLERISSSVLPLLFFLFLFLCRIRNSSSSRLTPGRDDGPIAVSCLSDSFGLHSLIDYPNNTKL
eukprot:gene12763-8702_t